MKRDYKYDTIKLLLIFFVIFGHLLEQFNSPNTVTYNIYRIIYSFHMPVFIFITGKFAKYDSKKIIKHLFLPYITFQTLYTIFNAKFLLNTSLHLQYTTPYWIMWYLLTTIYYYLIIPFLPEKKSNKYKIVLLIAFILSILSGFDSTLGYYMSISRTIVFLPFFILGYYHDSIKKELYKGKKDKIYIVILGISFILFGEYFVYITKMPITALYGSYSYSSIGGTLMERIAFIIAATGWIIILNNIITEKESILSKLGKNTFAIYIIHGFIVKTIFKYNLLCFSEPINILLSILISISIILLFGNDKVKKILKRKGFKYGKMYNNKNVL